MKHISDIVNVSSITITREEKTEQNTLDPTCSLLVDYVFVKFALLFREYDALYEDTRRENAEKLQWTLAFTKRNLRSKNQIQNALDRTEEHKYGKPPQLGQFLEWCTPSAQDLRLPDVHQAFQICGKINELYSTYNHPHIPTNTVLKHVIKQIGATKFRGMTEKDGYKVFGHYYVVACRDYAKGIIQDIPIAIPETITTRPIDRLKSDEARRKCMQAIKDLGIPIATQEEKEKIKEREPLVEEDKEKPTAHNHPEFEEKLINKHNASFDRLSIPETDIPTLPVRYAYDRMRFIADKEQPQLLLEMGYSPKPGFEEKSSPRGSQGPFRASKHWNGD